MMKRRFLVIGAILLLGIGGTVAWRLLPLQKAFYTDADTIKAPKAAAALRQILWQPPRRLPDIINTSGEDYEPRIAADGRTLLFVRRKAGNDADIYFSRKQRSGWSEPTALAAVNSDSDDLGPVLTHDGSAIYFYSNRAGSIGGYDLWVARRRAAGVFEFDEPVNLGAAVNSAFNEYGPALTPSGDRLYFSSNRPLSEDATQPDPNAWSATLREEVYQRTYDLYASVLNDRGVGVASPLTVLNTPANEGAPAVSPVGDFLYFASDRSGGQGGFDLYRSRRLRDAHESPHNLGKTVNSPANDLDPSLGLGGYGLFFSSDRVADAAGAMGDDAHEYNLFQTQSREVFVDSELIDRAPINWAALWAALWPNLLWMLIALSLAALLLALMRQSEERRLSLLMRCLLGSVLAHLVLVMILTIWGVSASIAGEFSRRGKIRISLASAASGQDLASQITGGLTTVKVPTFEPPAFSRAEAPEQKPVEASEARLAVQRVEDPIERAVQAEMTLADATVKWQPEAPGFEKPKAFEQVPVNVSVSTPTESSRMSAEEFARAAAPSETVDVRRPDVVVSAAAQANQSVTVAPVASPALDQQAVMRESLVEPVLARGAAPMPDNLGETFIAPTPSDLPPTPGLQLAANAVEKRPQVSESLHDPSERAVAVPYLRVVDVAEAEVVSDVQASLVPAHAVPSGAVVDDFGAQQLAGMPDSSPNADLDAALALVVRPALSVANGAPVDVSTPAESMRIDAVAEVADGAAPATVPQGIRPANLPVASGRAAPKIDQLDPDHDANEVAQASIASRLRDAVVDQSMPDVPLAKLPVPSLDVLALEGAAIDVMVPQESAQIANAVEAAERIDAVVGLKALRPTDLPVKTRRTAPQVDRLEPQRDVSEFAEASVVPDVREAVVDQTMPDVKLAQLPLAAFEVSVPDGTSIEVMLPQESAQVATALEPVEQTAIVIEPDAIRPAAARVASDHTAPRINVLRPDRDPPALAEASIASRLLDAPVDQSIPDVRIGKQAVAPLDMTNLDGTYFDVSLPQELARVANTSETEDRMASVVNQRTPKLARAEVELSRDASSIDRFAPDRDAAAPNDVSLAAALGGAVPEQDPPDVSIATLSETAVAVVMPAMSAIELPRVEESEAVVARESSDPVQLVALVDLRAAVDPQLSRSVRARDAQKYVAEPARRNVRVASREASLMPDAMDPDDAAPVIQASYREIEPMDIPNDMGLLPIDIELSPEESAPENAFVQRSAPNKMALVKRMGGSEETEEAVALALKWLAKHQDEDGYWDIRVYDKRCGGCDDTKAIEANVALTGLATLCFLGAGHTHVDDGPYTDTVAKAIDWLLEQQAANGDLRGEETMYTQGIASIALAEALAMTGDQRLREPVTVAMRFIYAARNRQGGGWRYDPGQDGDTSVLGWMMMAMKSAATNGLPVPRDAFEAGGDWLLRVADPSEPGLYKYRPERDVTPSMTAEGMYIQQLLGKTSVDADMQASADYILQHLPNWDEDPNTYFWYYASLALFQHQGQAWTTWNDALKHELVDHQRRDARAAGSWDPQGNEWSVLGGRVYQTALCTLMMEVYYRYLPMYSDDNPTIPERPEDAVGTIAGVVRDAETGEPLVGATVRLDVPGGKPILAQTDRDGFYYVWAPELPPYFALSAAMEGHIPESENVDSSNLHESVLDVDFDLRVDRGEVLMTEAIPEVHHLGDNRFEGRINSQFQKETEGAEYGSEFVLAAEQVSRRFHRAEVRLMAKGVQRRHSLFINGILLDKKLARAPRDGSFGEFRASFDLDLLRVGSNTFDLVAKPSSSDIDDFEFVNVQIYLLP